MDSSYVNNENISIFTNYKNWFLPNLVNFILKDIFQKIILFLIICPYEIKIVGYKDHCSTYPQWGFLDT